jgi:VanZ family protein
MAAIMGIIFYLSHQPGDFVQLPKFIGADKLLHIIAYGSLAGAFLYGLHPFTHNSNEAVTAIVVVLFCLLFAISDEFHQGFIPGRFVSAWDVAADCFGALLVVGWRYKHRAGEAEQDYS